MQNYVFAPGYLFNSETEEATTDRSYGRSALWANYEFLLLIISFYAFSGCCRRTHKLFELGKFHQQSTIAKTSVDARKARVGCRRKILLNSWSYGARWVADHLFDSMSSVVGDRAVAQADHSLPRCDGKVAAIDACAATKAATTAGAMWVIGTVEERVKIKPFDI